MIEAQLKAHYSAVRARLMGPPPRPVKREPIRAKGRRMFGPPCPKLLPGYDDWRAIVNRVTVKTGITLAEMRSPSREFRLREAKFECWYLLRMETKFSYPKIGQLFGGKDHTTIYHGACRWAEMNGLERPR